MILSFVKCIDKSSFDSLSITSLCLVAGVNRSTFYAHYDNLGELLEDAWKYMVDSFFAELDISENPSSQNLTFPRNDSAKRAISNRSACCPTFAS